MIPFKDLTLNALTVTGKERKTELFATLVNVLSNVQYLTWHICFQYPIEDFEHLAIVKAIAESNSNTLVIHQHTSEQSVAASKAIVLKHLAKDDLVFNVDDDHIFPYKTLSLLHYVIRHKYCRQRVITCAAVDVLDIHGYEDWSHDFHAIGDLFPSIERFGLKSAAHQKWDTSNVSVLRTDYISNGWVMPVKFFSLPDSEDEQTTVLHKMETWPKGIRGYDCMIQEALIKNNIPIYLLVGGYIEHVGMKTFNWSNSKHSDPYQKQIESRLAPTSTTNIRLEFL